MRRARFAVTILIAVWFIAPRLHGLAQGITTPTGPGSSFHLYLMGHWIGLEEDTPQPANGDQTYTSTFHYDDRGAAIDLTSTFELAGGFTPRHLIVKGKTYRYFSSDVDVRIDGRERAHIRDGARETDVDLANRPTFPLDGYAPIGQQELLLQYWLKHGRPAEISAPPVGIVRIRPGSITSPSEALAPLLGPGGVGRSFVSYTIDGVVWGRETAFVDAKTNELLALTTWAGALPFEAVRIATGSGHDMYTALAVQDRIDDLNALTSPDAAAHGLPSVTAAQTGVFALVGATVVSGAAAASIPDATVLIANGRITAVGPSSSTPVPEGVPVVDVKGRTIIPGLWDMHAHAGQVDWAPTYLASGVTTIRDMGGEEEFLVAFRDAVAQGALGPRILLAGLVDGPGKNAFGAVTAGTPVEGVKVVGKYHDEGFQQIKIYTDVKPDVVAAIIAEAHRLGMTVTGHVPSGMTSQSVVEAGFDNIAHMQLRGVSGSDASKAQIAFFKAHGTVMDPTESWNEFLNRAASTPLSALHPDIDRLPPTLFRLLSGTGTPNANQSAIHAQLVSSLKLLKDAVDAGVPVVAGTDKGIPGFSVQREIELYVEGGMTPLQALQSATIVPARVMKLDADVGTVEVGKRADSAILEGNPLDKIANIRTAVQVVANGKLYDCDPLWRAAGFQPRKH